MTTRRAITLLLSLAAATHLLAQGKNMGQAGQYYKQNTKFKFVPGPKQKGGEVRWTVAPQGRVEVEKDEYALLENDVHVYYQDIKLQADKVTINLKTKDAVAEGHVIVDQGPARITADHAVFNLDTKLGTFFNSTGTFESLSFGGDKIEKVDEDTYHLVNGIFTSCDLDKPAWSFHVRDATVTLDDYAHLRDVTFRAHDMPIIWSPRLIWPTKKDRSQGFLIPRVSFGGEFGPRFEIGYFIPFGQSVDATIYGDLNTSGYNGLGTIVRYLPSKDVKIGQLDAYAVHDAAGKKEQWRYQFKHAQDNLPGGFRGVVDVEDFSDLDFFRRWARDPRLHTLSNIYSSAYLTRNWPGYSLNFLTDRRDIVLGHSDPTDPNSPILKQRFQQLPSLQFRMYPQRLLGTPLYFALESSSSHLETSGLINGPQASYFRTDLFPTLSLQLRTPPWLSIRPQISVRDTYYSQSLDPASENSAGVAQETIDESINRRYAQGQVELVGPSVSRIYNKKLGSFTRLKHLIEPRIRYIYTSSVNDQDRVIRFDTVDSPFLPIVRDSVEYSLTQRIIAKEATPNSSPREIMSFSVRQTVSLSKAFTNTTAGSTGSSSSAVDLNQKFTPLVAQLHINPYQSITLDASTTFGNVSHQIDQTSVSANLFGTGKNADKYLSFSWFATFQQPIGNTGIQSSSSSQIRLNTGSSLLRDRIRGDIQISYDAKTGKFLEQRYLLGGTASCYGVALEYRQYLVYTPFEKKDWNVSVAITLKNVGTIGTH
ncbi:MAG TPA: LPS assembly protein LptD [Thermoanaerobaculia bacterium]|nr:LPS assembly protein LptD [Thermoanaerobaculia bacterium]